MSEHELDRFGHQSLLDAAGFDPAPEGGLYHKNGVWYGKKAALQYARRERREPSEPVYSDEA